MAGWVHLPRYVDKIRLHMAGRLHPDYQPNFGRGFDGWWLEAAGLSADKFIEVVRGSITDGEVCDWVAKNVHKTPEEKAAHLARMMDYPKQDDPTGQERLQKRKEAAGLASRTDIRTFVDFIDADERRI